jgi:hypothetical protein
MGQMVLRIKRREFLETAIKAAGAAALGAAPVFQSRCKGGPDGARDSVTVNITFFNHTQGELGQRTYSGLSGDGLTIRIGDLGFGGVDGRRIALRKAAGPSQMGSLVKFSNIGAVSAVLPSNNENWEAYLMNAGSDYALVDDQQTTTSRVFARDLTWRREDVGTTGPDEPILEAVRQLQGALDHPWKKYGAFRQDAGGLLSVGYRIQDEPAFIGSYGDYFIRVSPEICDTFELRLKYFIQSFFRFSTYSGGLGSLEAHSVICNQATGNLNSQGRDFLAYIYVKDL